MNYPFKLKSGVDSVPVLGAGADRPQAMEADGRPALPQKQEIQERLQKVKSNANC